MTFEFYADNLELIDKSGLQDVNIDKSVIFKGDFSSYNRLAHEPDYHAPPLAAAVLGINNTRAPRANKTLYHTWTDLDAQELRLKIKPTCYLILGKPGVGGYGLGEALAKKFNCIHLSPKNIIQDELDQKSPTGNCMEYNLKHNKVITYSTILTLLKLKAESAAVQHRGYIISGFPLISCNKKPHQLILSLFSEEGYIIVEELLFDIICNLKKKKPKPPKQAADSPQTSVTSEQLFEEEAEEEQEEEHVEEEEAEEEEPRAELPKFILDSCSDVIHSQKIHYKTKKAVILQQIQDVFGLKLKADVIIYVTCPDIDLVTKKKHKYYNYKTSQYTVDPFNTEPSSDLRWPTIYTTSDYVNPYDVHVSNPKYYCRHPLNFTDRATEQICNYKEHLHSYLQKKIQDIDPKFIIKLDGRTSFRQMLHNTTERLIMFNFHPVIIPEPLYLEEIPEDLDEFWKSIEEIKAIHSDNLHFKRFMSPWFNRCPVELKNRRSVKGNPRYAVMFFRHVYLLSSLKAMILFCRNPRPFLKLRYLEPTCRVIVTGTKSSGKTMVSECLSWLFDAPIICYKNFLETEKQRKYETFAKSILSEIIATIEDARFTIWQRKELDRVAYLNGWCELTLKIVADYVVLLRQQYAKKNKAPREEQMTIEEESKWEEEEEELEDIEFLKQLSDLKKQLLFLPMVDDLMECERILAQRDISNYAPIELRTVTAKPTIPVLGDEDVTKAISAYIIANELQKELEPTTDELMSEMVKHLLNIDEECQEATESEQLCGKYIIDGFPSDPEYWRYLSDAKLMPDYAIGLIENRELDPDLIKYYSTIDNHVKNYSERFILANDPFILLKLQVTKPVESKSLYMKMIVNASINEALETKNEDNLKPDENEEINSETQFVASFTEAIEKFREDWDSVKLNVEECDKCCIEIELENKTDVQMIEELLLKLRKSYFLTAEVNEDVEVDDQDNNEDENEKDLFTYNDSQFFCETNKYCPITYYDYGVLWEGKPEFSLIYNNKVHYFCKEEYIEQFQKDITKYQTYNSPFKKLPSLKICVIGCIGSGKTTISKHIAKELGLIHINFVEVVNNYLMPRHFKKVGRQYENSFTDVPIDEEGVVEFQMDEENENLLSDILSNETELRRMVYNYFERGTPLLSILMQKLIKKLWFEPPFVKTGFILNGYPRLPTDIEDMVACNCIPDLVLELQSSAEVSLSRVSPVMMKTWKAQLKKAQEVAKHKLHDERQNWMNFITKNVVVKLLCDEILDNMPIPHTQPVGGLSTDSVIMDAHPTGSANVDPKLFNIYNEMIQEYPEPKDTSEWEKPDDVRERIDARIEGIYETDDENIQALKDILSEQRIKTVSIDATKPLTKVIRVALLKLTSVRNRNESFFEQTFIVKHEIAEMLLAEGFCFLSKFGRMGPVFLYEHRKTILNFYKVNRRNGTCFPVIHRSYIYFINGVENVKKFRNNPLIYIVSKAIKTYVEYPLRIGVIGPPKSGKSSLAAKIAKRHGLICISRGKAVRYVLENMPWTELASLMKKALYRGECINSDLVMKAVQTLSIDHRTYTQGFVLDGFPNTPPEAMELDKDGLYPNIIFDINAEKDNILRNSQNEIYYDILKLKPPYSYSFIEYRFTKWYEKAYKIRNWIHNDYQNLYAVNGNDSKWQCLQDAHEYKKKLIEKIQYYLANVKTTIVPVKVMCMSSEIFKQKMSPFKNLCPLCLRQSILKHSGYPVDRDGIVQFRNKYYWICSDHMGAALSHPHTNLLNQKITIPELPIYVKTVNVDLVHENGICIVTYAENLPSQIIERGSHKYAVSFKGITYLLCSEKCLQKFLCKPHLYAGITVFKETKLFPPISLDTLPNLGYLEQTLGNIITEACCSVNVVRPKYPGLSFQVSALIYLALYFKTHNPRIDKSELRSYVKALRVFEARSKLIIDVGLRLRSMENPFAKYPKCIHRVPIKVEKSVGSLDQFKFNVQRSEASFSIVSDDGSY